MHSASKGLRRRADYWIVTAAMATLAMVLEWFVARSVRRAAKRAPGSRPVG